MFTMLNNYEIKRLKEIEDITGVDYEITGRFIPVDNVVAALFDLLCEYNHKVEELEDLKSDLNDNYTPKHVDPYEECGVSINDFI